MNMEETLYWFFSTVPQTLAAGIAVMVAVVMPHVLAFSNLTRSLMTEVHQFWVTKESIDPIDKSELSNLLDVGNAPTFLELAKKIGDKYGLPEHDDGAAYTAETKRKTAADLFRRRGELLRETGYALSVVAFTIMWSLVLLVCVDSLSAPARAIPAIALTLVFSFASMGWIYRLARKTLISF